MVQYILPADQAIRYRGRVYADRARASMFFNWSASGFEVRFRGTRLEMDVEAFKDIKLPEGESLPCVMVITDDDETNGRRLSLQEGRTRYVLWEGPEPEEHHITVVKLSENSQGRNCLYGLAIQGELLPLPRDTRPLIEFVGDSITCGFGNEQANEELFATEGENALKTYAATAARLLDCAMQLVCISGIPLCWSPDRERHVRMPMPPYLEVAQRTMEDYYPYTDCLQQQMDGCSERELWAFDRASPAAVVVNLGTNDAFRVSVTADHQAEEAHFYQRYIAFLKQVRLLNGPRPVIACTLGAMNYYLYDTIRDAVRAYQQETGDQRVFCMKFGAIDIWAEGYGGGMHPNVRTHERMGRELAAKLKPWLERED